MVHTTWVNLKTLCNKPDRKGQILGDFHLYEVLRIVKYVEVGRLEVTRVWGAGGAGVIAN